MGNYVDEQNCRIWCESSPRDIQAQYIPKKLLFGEDFKLAASLVHIFKLALKVDGYQQLTTFGFNRKAVRAIQLMTHSARAI